MYELIIYLGILYIDAFRVPRSSSHSMAIDILSFNLDPKTLLLLPPNQNFSFHSNQKIINIGPKYVIDMHLHMVITID